MYCPSCGVALAQGLRFCNYCGARLNSSNPAAEPREVKPEALIGAMAVVFIFGLAAVSLLVLLLSESVHLAAGQIMGFAGFCLLIIAALEAVFITLLFRRKPRTKEANEPNQLEKPVTRELHAMPDVPEGFPSVTEHTTRAFDPIYSEQVKK